MQKPDLSNKGLITLKNTQKLSSCMKRVLLFAIILLVKIVLIEKVQAQKPSQNQQKTQINNIPEGRIYGIQSKSEIEKGTKHLADFPQVMPVYKNGREAGMNKFLAENLKALTEPANGLVFCSILIGTDGKVSNPEILKGINPEADQEALRVVQLLEFNPGKQFDQVVPVRMMVKVKFGSK